MTDRETVLEARVTADLTIHLPLDDGDRVIEAIRGVLDDVEAIRGYDVQIDQVYPIEEY